MNGLFCKNLRDARKGRGFTQKQVAKLLDVVESCYANWEQGRTEPNTLDLQRLCLIFDITADYLLGLESEDGTKIASDSVFRSEALVQTTKAQAASNKNKAKSEEQEILETLKKLSKSNKTKLLGFSKGLLEAQNPL